MTTALANTQLIGSSTLVGERWFTLTKDVWKLILSCLTPSELANVAKVNSRLWKWSKLVRSEISGLKIGYLSQVIRMLPMLSTIHLDRIFQFPELVQYSELLRKFGSGQLSFATNNIKDVQMIRHQRKYEAKYLRLINEVFPRTEVLHMVGSCCRDISEDAIRAIGDFSALVTIDTNAFFSTDALLLLAESSRNWRQIYVNANDISDSGTLFQLLSACPFLECLDNRIMRTSILRWNEDSLARCSVLKPRIAAVRLSSPITNAVVQSLSAFCNLQSVMSSQRVSYDCALRSFAATKLTEFSVQSCTIEQIRDVSSHGKLEILSVNDVIWNEPAQPGGVYEFLPDSIMASLSRIKCLRLDNARVTESSLGSIERYCQRLEELCCASTARQPQERRFSLSVDDGAATLLQCVDTARFRWFEIRPRNQGEPSFYHHDVSLLVRRFEGFSISYFVRDQWVIKYGSKILFECRANPAVDNIPVCSLAKYFISSAHMQVNKIVDYQSDFGKGGMSIEFGASAVLWLPNLKLPASTSPSSPSSPSSCGAFGLVMNGNLSWLAPTIDAAVEWLQCLPSHLIATTIPVIFPFAMFRLEFPQCERVMRDREFMRYYYDAKLTSLMNKTTFVGVSWKKLECWDDIGAVIYGLSDPGALKRLFKTIMTCSVVAAEDANKNRVVLSCAQSSCNVSIHAVNGAIEARVWKFAEGLEYKNKSLTTGSTHNFAITLAQWILDNTDEHWSNVANKLIATVKPSIRFG